MNTTKSVFVRNVALAACLAIPAVANVARAQDGQDATSLAPPVQTTPAPAAGTVNDPAASVFNWKDVPTNQHIKITRAVFDQGGYQLYASTGETIIVPFENNNLYVMKFGQTIGGAMYFVNDGSVPTLYMSKTGYLENTAAQGAKWYPFSDNYDYTGPVYEGIAPSWDAYQGMGWYPGMVCYGGYWGLQPWGLGVGFECMPGFCFNIFGEPYFGWGGYFGYYGAHPYGRFGWGHEFGHYGGAGGIHGGAFGRSGAFGGAGVAHGVGGFSGRTAGVSSAFGGASGAHRAFSAQPSGGGSSFGSSSRAFGGVTSRAFGNGNMGVATVSRSPFSGGSFGGSRAFNGGSGGGGSFGGGTRAFSGGSSFGGGGSHSSGGGGSFGGGGGGGHFGGGGGGHR